MQDESKSVKKVVRLRERAANRGKVARLIDQLLFITYPHLCLNGYVDHPKRSKTFNEIY